MIAINDNSHTMIDCFDYVNRIEIINNGKVRMMKPDNKYFAKTVNNLKKVFSCARLLPALGVSLHDDTIVALRQGRWLKVYFSKEMEKNGLPFENILLPLEQVSGTNIIREYHDRYDGRCLYVDFDQEIDLYEELF